MTAPDARDELREALAEAVRRHLDEEWIAREGDAEDFADALLPAVTAWAEKQARARAAEELVVLASRLVSQDVEDMAVYEEIRALRDALATDARTDAR